MEGDLTMPELRTAGALQMLDGALLAVRRGGLGNLLRAWLGAGPLALLVLAVYYLERVEGVRSLRPLLAVSLVLAFWLRCVRSSRVARDYALALRSTLPVSTEPTSVSSVLCTASVVGLGLSVWLWPLLAMAALTPFAVAAVLPLMALRGAVAPSWLARASCARERGLAAFGQAFDDTAGMRGVFSLVELLGLLGAIGLFGNLYALTSLVVLLGHSMLGLDVAFVSSFLSPDNTLVLLLIAALTLVAIEPLQAAISAQAFVDARSRRDGADLHAAVDAIIAGSAPRSSRARTGGRSEPPMAVAMALLALVTCAVLPARAETAGAEAPTADAPESPEARPALDAEVRAELGTILSRSEFRDFAEHDSSTLRELFDKLLRWLEDRADEDEPQRDRMQLHLPPLSPWVLMGLAALALGAIALYVARSRRRALPAPVVSSSPSETEVPSGPRSLLDEAARLAARGEFHAALRALYLATLFALDRARLIDYDPAKTNWQYIRGLPGGELRQAFSALTRIFDRTLYGHEPATRESYEQCRQLVDRIDAVRRP